MPFVDLSVDDARRVRNGMEVRFADKHDYDWPDEQQVRMRSESGQLIAIGVFDKASCRLHPRVVIEVEKD
jgi:tRNA U55 pseudouridine synthase TruB